MKIACIGYLHGAGGAERQIIMLANALSERGHEVHLAILAENKSNYDINAKVGIHDLTNVEAENGNKILNRFHALKKLLNALRPDISIHYWLQSAYFCALMGKSVSGKIIYSERGDPGDVEYRGLLGIIRHIAFKRVDGFVFQSEGARDFFGNKVRAKSIVIHNSVAVPNGEFLEPCKTRENRIVNVGRLHPQKNQMLLIEAFADLSNDFPNFTLEIYGEGKLQELLEKRIKDAGLEERVFLRGAVNDILDKIYTASLFVLSSDYEGMPNALMEAMAIGVPCISTDCRPGGARTLIQSGINGWITPVGNKNELAKQMAAVLRCPLNAEKVAYEALKIRDTHTSEAVFCAWEDFLKEC